MESADALADGTPPPLCMLLDPTPLAMHAHHRKVIISLLSIECLAYRGEDTCLQVAISPARTLPKLLGRSRSTHLSGNPVNLPVNPKAPAHGHQYMVQ